MGAIEKFNDLFLEGGSTVELKQLRSFIAVADMGGFSKAARMLFISQPTLSYQISSLEEEIGQKLFIRQNNTVTLTPVAREMYEPIKNLLGEVDNIKFRLQHHGENEKSESTLRVGVARMPPHESALTVNALVDGFAEAHGVTALYDRLSLGDCVAAVRDGELDVAFINMRGDDKLPNPFIFRALWEDRFVLLVARSCGEVDLRTAVETFELTQVEQLDTREQDVKYILSGLKLKPRTRTVPNLDAAFSQVEQGSAAMLWPRSDYNKYLRRKMAALEIPGEQALFYFGAIWNSGNDKQILHDFTETL